MYLRCEAHGTILINFGSEKRSYIFEFLGAYLGIRPSVPPPGAAKEVRPPPKRKILDPRLSLLDMRT